MLIKLIQCDVYSKHRDTFARGQREWRALRNVEGFRGQIGGWNADDPNQAVIVGLWRDQPSYEHFMRDTHDRIFASNGQEGTYQASSILLCDRELDIVGSLTSISDAVEAGGLIRLARCLVRPDRREHFTDVQKTIWNPGMGAAGGMLVGVFCRVRGDEAEFLVCTVWRTEEDHSRYRATVVHDLRARAEVEKDCESLQGTIVRVEPTWAVAPERQT